jgi:hypothetical protein
MTAWIIASTAALRVSTRIAAFAPRGSNSAPKARTCVRGRRYSKAFRRIRGRPTRSNDGRRLLLILKTIALEQ